MAKYSIRPIPLAMGAHPWEGSLYRIRAGAAIPIVVYVFFIEGAKRKILVDAGGTADGFKQRGANGYRHIQSLDEGLAKVGLKPEDIDLVILTHLHYDHVDLAPRYTHAKFLLQKAELDWNLNPSPIDPRPCDRRLLDSLNLQVIEGDYQLEDGIKVLFTPGHTAGGQSVAVDTAAGLAIIDGLCSSDENFNPPESMKWSGPVAAPSSHTDPMLAYNNLLRIKKMADIVVPLHEARLIWAPRIPPQ